MATVAQLLADIKRKGFIQSQGTVYSDADIIDMANKELQMVIVPKILSVRENYYACFKDYALTAQTRYRLPRRIAGGRISRIIITDGNDKYELKYSAYQLLHTAGYFIDNNEIVITGDPGQTPTGTMRVHYPCRPPKMSGAVSTSPPAITAPSSSATNLSVTTANGSYEVIRANSPCTTITPNLTVATNVGTDSDMINPVEYYGRFEAGDLVIGQDATPYVPLQEELCDWLAERVVARIKEALGHREEFELTLAKIADMEKDGLALISPRVEESEHIIIDKETLGWTTWR